VCCSMLQCFTVCCSVFQCVAACCSALQRIAVCCTGLQCVAVCCSILQNVSFLCSLLQCVAVCCSMLQFVAVCCSEMNLRIALTKGSAYKRLCIQGARNSRRGTACNSALPCVLQCMLQFVLHFLDFTHTVRWKQELLYLSASESGRSFVEVQYNDKMDFSIPAGWNSIVPNKVHIKIHSL